MTEKVKQFVTTVNGLTASHKEDHELLLKIAAKMGVL